MLVKIFVNWRDEEILTESKYNERTREMAEDLRTDGYDFSKFLEQHYTCLELFEANEEERAKIMERWVDQCLEAAYIELGHEEVILDV